MNTTPNSETVKYPNNFNAATETTPPGTESEKEAPQTVKSTGAPEASCADPLAECSTAKSDSPTLDFSTKKDQLRRRVEARKEELEQALACLKGKDANHERCNALSTELAYAESEMSGGWDRVGEIEARKLSQWLDATEYLTEKGQADLTPIGMPEATAPADEADKAVKTA